MDRIEELAEIYKAFADPTRLKIIKLLAQYERACVNAITGQLEVSQSAVSQHLRVLRQIKLVNSNRIGANIHYELNKEKIAEFRTMIQSILGKEF